MCSPHARTGLPPPVSGSQQQHRRGYPRPAPAQRRAYWCMSEVLIAVNHSPHLWLFPCKKKKKKNLPVSLKTPNFPSADPFITPLGSTAGSGRGARWRSAPATPRPWHAAAAQLPDTPCFPTTTKAQAPKAEPEAGGPSGPCPHLTPWRLRQPPGWTFAAPEILTVFPSW